ncbi:hypothetical protein J4T85_006705 [Sinorhizobium medicae]|uniref:hypothetical protein n=1 Tax=Sinorhizobium medicae TaxID=110321 RepID=UPI001AAE72D2|nr:hypothetical protein [Sinorhizobium medicae]MBO1962386.1 hypothetical protein [Sinorhizobium medicae]
MSEQRWQTPATWVWASMGGISEVVGGGTPATGDESNFAERGIAWLQRDNQDETKRQSR